MKRVVRVVMLGASLMVAAASATASQGVTQCGTITGAGHACAVATINVRCAFAKSWFPKLLKEKWYGKVARVARIKPPPGFQPCGVSFPPTGGTAKYIAIECLKNAPAAGAITFTRT